MTTPPIAPPAAVPAKGKTIPLAILPKEGEGKPLVWDESRRRFQLGDAILTAADLSLALAFAIVKPLPSPWRGGVLFDDGARRTLRIGNADTRNAARDSSDVLLSLQVMGPFLIDSLVTAWWYRGSKDVATEIALIDLETMTITAAVQGAFTTFSARERPYGQTCGGELPENSIDCRTFGRYRSYFSGHTSLAFTSGSLVCWHHLELHLFEDATTDALSCVGAMTAAVATGALRVMSDQHYTTDVMTGAIVGMGIGFGMPYLLHGKRSSMSAPTERASDLTLRVVPTGLGASAVGTF